MFKYERFTDRARKVMQLANQESQRFKHEYIGTEHILLGLIKEGAGVAANVLKNLGLNLPKIRLEVEKFVQSRPGIVMMGKLPQTPQAKKVIEYAIEEARNPNHNYVGTEHLLLGLLRAQEGVAAQLLMNRGLKLEDVRAGVLRLLGREMPAKPFPFLLGKFCRRVLRLLGWEITTQKRNEVPSHPMPIQSGSDSERIHSLEQQIRNVRIVLGALVGALAGALLLAQFGAVMGLLLGGLVAGLGWRTLGVLAGGSVGVLIGCTHLPNDGGGLSGALLGALVGFLIVEMGGPFRGR